MAIKHYKPTTNGRRNMTTMDYSELSKVAPEKSLLEPIKKHAGRNSYGRITVRHRGGGNRRKYRVIDFNVSVSEFRQQFSPLNTILTVLHSSPSFSMRMVRSVTLSLLRI